jgi:predicted regulator of Ras-like GTPase activity (Roadblock/LC7/MglB family)
MISSKYIEVSKIEDDQVELTLKKVVSDLRKGSDIEGAVIVDEKEAIIACDLPESTNYEAEIPEILAIFEEDGYAPSEHQKGMFAQSIFDYNGYKVLAKKLKKKLTLLVLLKKRGYISLAMLDIENSIRRIYEILGGSGIQKPFDYQS